MSQIAKSNNYVSKKLSKAANWCQPVVKSCNPLSQLSFNSG